MAGTDDAGPAAPNRREQSMEAILDGRRAMRVVLALAALLALAPAAMAAPDAAMYAKCAKACSTCMASCKACNTHCEAMVKSGMKQQVVSARLSADCRDLCDVAARLTARKGPMTAAACTACAEGCDACGKECRKYPSMKPMADCAKSCDACAKACREMIAAS